MELDPLLPDCSQHNLIPREVRLRLSERSDQECHSCLTEARSKGSCQLIVNTDSILPANPYPPLPACSQWRQMNCYQHNLFYPYQWSQINCYPLAPSNARYKTSCQLIANSDSLLPAKPDPLPPAGCWQSGFHTTSYPGSTSTSLLQGKAVSLLPANKHPPQPACSHHSQCHAYQQSWNHCYKWSQFQTYQRSRIHCYPLTPSKARLSERWEWACQSGETKHIGVLNVNLSELKASISIVKVSMSELWEWACQSCGSYYNTEVGENRMCVFYGTEIRECKEERLQIYTGSTSPCYCQLYQTLEYM